MLRCREQSTLVKNTPRRLFRKSQVLGTRKSFWLNTGNAQQVRQFRYVRRDPLWCSALDDRRRLVGDEFPDAVLAHPDRQVAIVNVHDRATPSSACLTFHAAGRHGELIAQWHTIKSAGLDALIANGGAVTHHHAVGRDHRPWYDRQRPPLFAAALKAAKATLDPRCLLNPSVLIDP